MKHFIRFTKWWPGWMNDTKQPPWVGYRPFCIVMKRQFPCYERAESTCDTDYFFWDTEDCATDSKGHSFICKRSYDDIGTYIHIYKIEKLHNFIYNTITYSISYLI